MGSDREDEFEADEDFEEDEDEYDEEEDEDSDDDRHKRRRKKKKPINEFIIDEAEVDDDYEDEEEWEDGAEDIIDKVKHTDDSAQRDMDSHRRLQLMLSSHREDEIEEYYRRKYAESSRLESGYDGDVDLSDDITQQALLPGVKDPNLWVVKCKIGEEKATVLQLMRKFIAYSNTEEPLQIKSVIAPEGD